MKPMGRTLPIQWRYSRSLGKRENRSFFNWEFMRKWIPISSCLKRMWGLTQWFGSKRVRLFNRTGTSAPNKMLKLSEIMVGLRKAGFVETSVGVMEKSLADGSTYRINQEFLGQFATPQELAAHYKKVVTAAQDRKNRQDLDDKVHLSELTSSMLQPIALDPDPEIQQALDRLSPNQIIDTPNLSERPPIVARPSPVVSIEPTPEQKVIMIRSEMDQIGKRVADLESDKEFLRDELAAKDKAMRELQRGQQYRVRCKKEFNAQQFGNWVIIRGGPILESGNVVISTDQFKQEYEVIEEIL